MVRRGLRILVAFLAFWGTASSQPVKILVQIHVDDGSGADLPHAKIKLTPLASPASGVYGETNDFGNASLELSPGNFQVLVSLESFCPHQWSLEIPREQTLNLTFSLRVGPCHISTVEVFGAPGSSQPESPGPPSETTPFEVFVNDTFGVRITIVDVKASCPDARLTVGTTTGDPPGQAKIALGKGECTISARALGFNPWSLKMNSQQQASRSVTAVLGIANQCAGCLSVERDHQIEFERMAPEETIRELVLKTAALPARKVGMHRARFNDRR